MKKTDSPSTERDKGMRRAMITYYLADEEAIRRYVKRLNRKRELQ